MAVGLLPYRHFRFDQMSCSFGRFRGAYIGIRYTLTKNARR